MNDPGLWIERFSALHRNLLRKFAAELGLQLVHAEIIQYLSNCNRYSDTTQGLSEYFGQTKGSISQSLSFLEENNFLTRDQDQTDKRVFHLLLTSQGKQTAKDLKDFLHFDFEIDAKADAIFRSILRNLQKQNGMKSFGICASCKFNENPGKDKFRCGLTQEILTKNDTKKICREHKATP